MEPDDMGPPVRSCSLDRPGTVEQRFGLLGCVVDGRVRRCELLVGGVEADGEGAAGLLAVLGDHVLGEAANHPQPPGMVPVTTGLSLDVLSPPPWRGDRLVAEAGRVRGDAAGRYVRATVSEPNGRPVAAVGAWMTHVPARGLPPLATGPAVPAESRAPRVADLLTAPVDLLAGGEWARIRLDAAGWTNQNGTLHGGVGASAAALLAERLLGTADRTFRTTHLDVSYLRPLGPAVVEVHAQVLHRGRSAGTVEVRAADHEGRPGLVAIIAARSVSATVI